LRSANITTLDDLRSFEGDLLTRLSGEYASLRTPTEDSNRSRWPLHPMWQALRATIGDMSRHGLVCSYKPDTPLAYAEEKSLRSIIGMLKNIGGIRTVRLHREEPVSLPELMAGLSTKLSKRIPPELWNEDVGTRAEKRRHGL